MVAGIEAKGSDWGHSPFPVGATKYLLVAIKGRGGGCCLTSQKPEFLWLVEIEIPFTVKILKKYKIC